MQGIYFLNRTIESLESPKLPSFTLFCLPLFYFIPMIIITEIITFIPVKLTHYLCAKTSQRTVYSLDIIHTFVLASIILLICVIIELYKLPSQPNLIYISSERQTRNSWPEIQTVTIFIVSFIGGNLEKISHYLIARKMHKCTVHNLDSIKMFIMVSTLVIIHVCSLSIDMGVYRLLLINVIVILALFFDILMCILMTWAEMIPFIAIFISTVMKLVDFYGENSGRFIVLPLMYNICFIKVNIFLTVWFYNIIEITMKNICKNFMQKYYAGYIIQLDFNLIFKKIMKVNKKQLTKCLARIILWCQCTLLNWPQSIWWLYLSERYILIFHIIILYELYSIVYQDPSYVLRQPKQDLNIVSLHLDNFNGKGILLQNMVSPYEWFIYSWILLKGSCCDFVYVITYLKLFDRKTAFKSLYSSLANIELIKENYDNYSIIYLCAERLEEKILPLLKPQEQTFDHVPGATDRNQSGSSVTSYPQSTDTPSLQDSMVNTPYQDDGNLCEGLGSLENNTDNLRLNAQNSVNFDLVPQTEGHNGGNLHDTKPSENSGMPSIRRKPKKRLDLVESSSLSDMSETVDRVSGRRCDNKYNVEDLRDL